MGAIDFKKLNKSSFTVVEIGNKAIINGPNVSFELPKTMMFLSYQYTPYYSKMHITARTVAHFDSYFGIGAGMVAGKQKFAISGTEVDGDSRIGGQIYAVMRFMFQNRWALKFELRDFIHQMENLKDIKVANHLQLSVSLSAFFGGFR